MKTKIKQTWEKLGLVFVANNNFSWMQTHAANPIAEHIRDDIFRICFNSRDLENKSHVAYIEININSPNKILNISSEPLLSPRERGAFDDSGVSIGCLLNVNKKKYLFYLGWNLCVTVPFRNSIGLAMFNEKENKFERVSKAPVLDRNDIDPFSLSYPFILYENNLFKMWYGSVLQWGKKEKEMNHVIKYAESLDGIMWHREGKISIDFKNKNESAITRPCIIKEKDFYKMWYCYKEDSYRIGYAESNNGINWERKDNEIKLDLSSKGWDSEMIEYPFVFDHKGKRYMLYNGNSYGKSGFGLAILNE